MTVLCLDCGERFYADEIDEVTICPYCHGSELEAV